MDPQLLLILTLLGIIVVAVILTKLLMLIKQKGLKRAVESLSADIKRELRKEPTCLPFDDSTRKEALKKKFGAGIGLIGCIFVFSIVISIAKQYAIEFALVVAVIFSFVVFILLIKDRLVMRGELYEVKAYCDYRIYGRYKSARLLYYDFKSMMFEADVFQNISLETNLKVGQFCYAVVKVKKNRLQIIDISPRQYENW